MSNKRFTQPYTSFSHFDSQHRRTRITMFGSNLNSALRSLRTNRLRSLLTMLGIIIGVAAVIASVTLTQGVTVRINARLASLGTNVITIYPGTTVNGGAVGALGSAQSLTADDAQAITSVTHVISVSPVNSYSAVQVVYGNQNWNTRLLAVTPSFQSIQSWQLDEGNWFSDNDEQVQAPAVVIGQVVANNLFSFQGIDPIGQTIRIQNQLVRVVGVLAPKGTLGASNQDDVIFIPFSSLSRLLGSSNSASQIVVQADSASNVEQVQQDITTLLEQRHHLITSGSDDFRLVSSNQLIQTSQQNIAALTALLVGIAAISLIVGGIGIMNVMLVSVTERTREIGIRMAVGASRRDICDQFLIESLTFSLVGGMIGILCGLVAGFALTRAAQQQFVVSPFSLLLSFGVAAMVGITFGLYPAIRASRLDPIVALHTE